MKQHQRPLAVGDFCTTKSRYPENRGLRVVVVEVVPGRTARGRPVPYSIQRVDGGMLPFTTDLTTGRENRYTVRQATIAGSRLVRLDIDGEDRRDVLVLVLGRDPLECLIDPVAQAAADRKRLDERRRRARVAANKAIERAGVQS